MASSCPIAAITTEQQTDRMGSHYVRLASDYIHAVQSRLEYCVTPWTKSMHASYASLPPKTKHPCRKPVKKKKKHQEGKNRDKRSVRTLRMERGECPED